MVDQKFQMVFHFITLSMSQSLIIFSENQTNTDKVGAAYTAMLLGCLVCNNSNNEKLIRRLLPKSSFESISTLLKQFVNFQAQAGILSLDVHKSIVETIKCIEALE